MEQAMPTTSVLDPATLAVTRRRLHGINECLMTGPQRRAGGRFTLRVTPGGFATTGAPALRLRGTDLLSDESRRVPVAGPSPIWPMRSGSISGPRPMAIRTAARSARTTTRRWMPRRPRSSSSGVSWAMPR